MSRILGALLAMIALVPSAQSGIHSVLADQVLQYPVTPEFGEPWPTHAVAIDGDSIIVIADIENVRQALLYRRAADGRWNYERTLIETSVPVAQRRAGLAMKNFIAAIDLDGQTTIWEKIGGVWVRSPTAGDIRQPGGIAISSNSILVGGDGCTHDGFIYQKNTTGTWGVTGRLPAQAGVCGTAERDVELNYDYALINDPAGSVRTYRRNGTALDWLAAGTFPLAGASAGRAGSPALQSTTAAAPGSTIYKRNGSTWALADRLEPVDLIISPGGADQVVYRDGVLLAIENQRTHVYQPDASGKFRNVAILYGQFGHRDVDIGARTVVALGDYTDFTAVEVFDLPTPLAPSPAVANDFNAHDVTGFEATPNFALAGSSSNDIYRVTNTTDAYAVATNSESTYEQSVTFRARLNRTLTTDRYSWVGAALRYIDQRNFYYVTVSRNIITVRKRVNGVDTTLNSIALSSSLIGQWLEIDFRLEKATLTDDPTRKWRLNVFVRTLDTGFGAYATDLDHGKAALIAHNATGDFDDFYAAPTRRSALYWNDFIGESVLPFAYSGGTWQARFTSGIRNGLAQSNTSVLALATAGSTTVGDQTVASRMTLDFWGSTDPVPWFGLLARYVDARNYYYLSVRGTNQVQIRKVVNGVTTVLAAKAYTVTPGQAHTYELRALGNQLHALVDGQVLATALDRDLPTGKFGLATYRAAANFDRLEMYQP